MNRSYSKIRHVQESNERLEKRMLSEQNTDYRKVYISEGYVDVTDDSTKTHTFCKLPTDLMNVRVVGTVLES